MGKVNAKPLATVADDADTLVGVQGGAVKQFPRSLCGVPAGRVLTVDGLLGDDATAVRGRLDRPYKTPAAAAAAAQSGDCVVVYPGTYPVTTSLNVTGVKWVQLPGATLSLGGGGTLPLAANTVNLGLAADLGNLARQNAANTFTATQTVNADLTVTGPGGNGGTFLVASNQISLQASGDFSGLTFIDANGSGLTISEDELHFTSAAGIVHFDIALPTADPHSAGVLWMDPAAGYALKVSQG